MQYMTEEEMIERINKLRKERNAVILTHNYQLGEVQDIADFVGDSLELSIKANGTDADVIVFCGVTFMAETAYILSPEKTVLLPRLESGCPMADMATAKDLVAMKAKYPNALVACYVNSTAEVKAESDICVTSANAVKLISKMEPGKDIIFVPDKNLGAYVQKISGRNLILWPGFCPTHMRITPEQLKKRIEEYPEAKVIVHPESRMDVIELADETLSTGGMVRFSQTTDAKQIIVATELGMIYRLQKDNPNKQFIPVSEQAICPNMKMTRLDDVLNALENMENIITVPEDIRVLAKKPIELMLELSK